MVLILLVAVTWDLAICVFIGVYAFSLMYSFATIYFEERIDHQHQKRSDFDMLITLSFIEVFIFHPVVFWGSIIRNIDLIREKKAGVS
ncbi:MAG: hypothetical protein ACJAUV_001292 [Flavobacteriales bacterium]|jgi:hypothetical protein